MFLEQMMKDMMMVMILAYLYDFECHVLTLVFVLFVCLNWSGRELGGHSMFCVYRLV